MTDWQPIDCPFCGEGDFDRPGLVNHIDHHCKDAWEARDEFLEYREREIAKRAVRP